MTAKLEFIINSYLVGFIDYKAKIQGLFPNIDLNPLDADEGMRAKEEVGSVSAEDMPVEDVGTTPNLCS